MDHRVGDDAADYRGRVGKGMINLIDELSAFPSFQNYPISIGTWVGFFEKPKSSNLNGLLFIRMPI